MPFGTPFPHAPYPVGIEWELPFTLKSTPPAIRPRQHTPFYPDPTRRIANH